MSFYRQGSFQSLAPPLNEGVSADKQLLVGERMGEGLWSIMSLDDVSQLGRDMNTANENYPHYVALGEVGALGWAILRGLCGHCILSTYLSASPLR